MRLLKSMGGGAGGNTSGVLDALKDMEDRIKEFCNDEFALKTDLDGLGGGRLKTPSDKGADVGAWPDAQLSKMMKSSDQHHNRILRNEKSVDELKR
jgi:hypothetical protein